jgi:alpha-galactosidase
MKIIHCVAMGAFVFLLSMGIEVKLATAKVVEKLEGYESKSGLVTQPEISFADQWVQSVVDLSKGSRVKDRWLDCWLNTNLPFSFCYGGREFDAIQSAWTYQARVGDRTKDYEKLQLVWIEPDTGFRIVCHVKKYLLFPAVEWMLTFENTGENDTKIIENVRALRLSLIHFQRNQGYTIRGCQGGRRKADDFMPFIWERGPEEEYRKFIIGNNNSSNNHLPFWSVESPNNRGLIASIGWTGFWNAELYTKKILDGRAEEMAISAGMPDSKTHFLLHPKEKVCSPRILLLLWEGDYLHGHNTFRRLLYKHYIHPVKGESPIPMVTVNSCFTYHGKGGYLGIADEKKLLPLIPKFIDLGAEAFVIDAGWYENNLNHWEIGYRKSFDISRKRYPDGFRSLSEPLKQAGVAFGLWFAPEKLGFSMEDTKAEVLAYINRYAKEELMTMYRQDCGGKPELDEPDRVGINEMKYYEDLYGFWDQIIAEHPNMIMEGCCGGGRRIDLETIQRFSWFQKSDRWFDSESDQCGLYGANMFLPGGYLNIPTSGLEDYEVWSSFAGQLCLAWHPIDADFDMEKALKQVELYKRIRGLLHGDFYPLTKCSLEEPWIGYQFHRTDINKGFVLLFRRNTYYSSIDIALMGLEAKKSYFLQFHGSGKEATYSGKDLAEGITVNIEKSPGAELMTYSLVQK